MTAQHTEENALAATDALTEVAEGMLRGLTRPHAGTTTGVDAEDLDRWRSQDLRLDALFTAAERARCAALADPKAQFAGIWCAKEAAVKALSPHVLLGLRDVEIRHEDDGRPTVRVLRRGWEHLGPLTNVSITRTSSIAIAIAVCRATEFASSPAV